LRLLTESIIYEEKVVVKRFGYHFYFIGLGISAFFSVVPTCFATITGSMSEKAIIERIKPIGIVNLQEGPGIPQVAAAPKASSSDIGKHRYEETCHICHDTGAANAPKLGDKTVWGPRIAEGIDVLVKHAMEGYNAMPPKGTCMTCDEDEIRKTVEYMVSKAK